MLKIPEALRYSGTLVDQNGKPIVGAKFAYLPGFPKSRRGETSFLQFWADKRAVITDTSGRFHLRVPQSLRSLGIHVSDVPGHRVTRDGFRWLAAPSSNEEGLRIVVGTAKRQ